MEDYLDMPPGFRFHPTDLEVVVNYLEEKVMNRHFTARAIGEIDLNTCEPWDLPCKAKMGEKEWYFFWRRDRKYPTGSRTNRATESGYWKVTGKDKEIYKGKDCLVGMKKTLVFYLGRAPRGQKTGWVMHEYRLEGKSLIKLSRAANDWVVCRVFHKNEQIKKSPRHEVDLWESSNVLPALLDSPPPDNSSSYSNMVDHLVPFSGLYPHHLMLPADQTQLFQFDSISTGFIPLHQDNHCKVERYYETSAFHNTDGDGELVARNTCCEGPSSPSSSVGPLGDLDNIWSY